MVLKTRPRVEAPPERPRAIATTLPPLPLGAPARAVAAMAVLRADEPSPVEQVRAAYDQTMRQVWAIWHMGPLTTDWSARLADYWTHLDARWENLTDATARECGRLHLAAEYEARSWFAPVLSELTDLTAVQLPDWRKALDMHAEAELALYDTPEAGR